MSFEVQQDRTFHDTAINVRDEGRPSLPLRLLSIVMTLAVFCLPSLAFGQAADDEDDATAKPVRIFEQQPFDRVTIEEKNEEVVLKVLPIPFPERRVPRDPRPSERDKLSFQLVKAPDETLQVYWKFVVKIELFEEMILAEARGLVTRKEYDAAYDYYDFLVQNYPKIKGLNAAVADYLVRDAAALYKKGQTDEAYSLLQEAWQKEPRLPSLPGALGVVTARVVEDRARGGDYRAAREILARGLSRYPQQPSKALLDWQKKIRAAALKKRDQSIALLKSGKPREAYDVMRIMRNIDPKVPGADALAAQIESIYPRVIVGVEQTTAAGMPNSLNSRPARRVGRLLHRMLAEQTEVGPDGGIYASPLVKFPDQFESRTFLLELLHKNPGGATGYDATRVLLDMADPRSPRYISGWGSLPANISVKDVFFTQVTMRRSHLKPQAWLRVPLSLPDTPGDGPYRLLENKPGQTRFVAKPKSEYPYATSTQPREIVERSYARSWDAVEALEQGEIDMLARVYPGSVARLKKNKSLTVGRYAVPSIHVLVPNQKRPLAANATFRRAIIHALDRETILKEQLLENQLVEDCLVISGPFPTSTDRSNSIAYASDSTIEPRRFDPMLARMLLLDASRSVATQKAKEAAAAGETPPATAEKPAEDDASEETDTKDEAENKNVRLTIGYPPSPIAQVACDAIARQLEPQGIIVTLTPLPTDDNGQLAAKCDFVYTELFLDEPVVDALRLFDEGGPVGSPSIYLAGHLHSLGQAGDWKLARKALHNIHRTVHNEAAVIPLWQLVDHYALWSRLRKVGQKPVQLYQNIEIWQFGSSKAEGGTSR